MEKQTSMTDYLTGGGGGKRKRKEATQLTKQGEKKCKSEKPGGRTVIQHPIRADVTFERICEPLIIHEPSCHHSKPRTQVVHCKSRKFDVYIGRPNSGIAKEIGKGYKWANNCKISPTEDRDNAIRKYEEFAKAQGPEWHESVRKNLQGKVLGCWCAPHACHGEVLARIADQADKPCNCQVTSRRPRCTNKLAAEIVLTLSKAGITVSAIRTLIIDYALAVQGLVLFRQLTPVRKDLIRVWPSPWSESDCDRFYHTLMKEGNWQELKTMTPGGMKMQPRKTCAWSRDGKPYTYNRTTAATQSFSATLNEVDGTLSELTNSKSTYFLGNGYETMSEQRQLLADHLSIHADADTGLKVGESIVSASFGQMRWFNVYLPDAPKTATLERRKPNASLVLTILTTPGIIIEMCEGTQQLLKHSVPRSMTGIPINSAYPFRLNLTGRSIA